MRWRKGCITFAELPAQKGKSADWLWLSYVDEKQNRSKAETTDEVAKKRKMSPTMVVKSGNDRKY